MSFFIRHSDFLGATALEADQCTDDVVEILRSVIPRAIKLRRVGVVDDSVVLRSLLLWENTVAKDALFEIVANPEELVAATGRHGRIDQTINIVFDFSEIETIYRSAKSHSSEYIGSEHLVYALLEAKGESYRILSNVGVTAERFRSTVSGKLT